MAETTNNVNNAIENDEILRRQQASHDQQENQAQAYPTYIKTQAEAMAEHFSDIQNVQIDTGGRVIHNSQLGEQVGQLAVSTATAPMQESEMAQAVRRVETAAQVASVAMYTFNVANAKNSYDQFINSAEGQQFLSDIGAGTKAQDDYKEYMSCMTYTDSNGQSINGLNLIESDKTGWGAANLAQTGSYKGCSMDNMSFNIYLPNAGKMTMTSADYYAAVANGGMVTQKNDGRQFSLDDCKVMTGDGKVTSMNVNDFMGKDMSVLMKNASDEQSLRATFMGAKTTAEKSYAMEKLFDSQVNLLKGRGNEFKDILEGASGRDDIMKRLSTLEKDIQKKINSGDLSAVDLAKARGDLKAIKDFGKNTKNVPTSIGMSGGQKAGMKTIMRYSVGDDMYRGISMISGTAKAVNRLTKATRNVGLKSSVTHAKNLQKFNNKILKNSKVDEFAQKLVDKKVMKLDKYKERDAARKNPAAWKEYKQKEKLEKFQKKNKKIDSKITKLNDKNSRLKNKEKIAKNNEKIKKLDDKKLKRNKKHDKKQARFNARNALRQKVADKVKNNILAKAIGNVVSFFANIKRIIFIALAAVGVSILGFCLLGILISLIATSINRFFSFETEFTDMLNNFNYNQYIVDRVSTELSKSFMLSASSDAEIHYLFEEDVPSDKYYWHKDVIDGSIGNIWMREEADDISSIDGNGIMGGCVDASGEEGDGTISAYQDLQQTASHYMSTPASRRRLRSLNTNIMPCLGMAMERYPEEVNFQNYPTVMAYMYYMYVMTHDLSRYDSADMDPYHYEVVDDCDNSQLYAHPRRWHISTASEGLNTDEYTDNAGEAKCSNIYIHGYDRAWGGMLNEFRVSTQNFAVNVINWVNDNCGTEFDTHFIPVGTELVYKAGDTIIYAGNPNNCNYHVNPDNPEDVYTTVSAFLGQYGLECDNCSEEQWSNKYDDDDDHYIEIVDDNGNPINNFIDGTNIWRPTICGKIQHTEHDDSCWVQTHQHNDGCYPSHQDDNGEWHTDYSAGPVNCPHNGHGRGNSCCWELRCPYATAQGGPNGETGLHDHYSEENRWNGLDDQGCWTTILVCGGHCGGHIRPVVDVVETYTWEGLMTADNFRTVHFVDEASFYGSGAMEAVNHIIGENVLYLPNVWTWKAYWQVQFTQWFLPFPTSPMAMYQCMARNTVYSVAGFIDAFTSGDSDAMKEWWESLWNGSGSIEDITEELKENPNLLIPDNSAEAGEDIYGFPGWWENSTTRNQTLVSDLIELYGDETDDYLLGRSAFDVDIWHVDFPTGPIKVLTQEEINEIMAGLGLSGNREAVVRGALEAVGNYYYAPSNSARNSAFALDHGPSDEAGFIDYIFKVNNIYIGGAGTLNPWAARATESYPYGYANKYGGSSSRCVVSTGTIEPGDVLINPTMDMNTHTAKMLVVISVGDTIRVVDCLNSVGGTKLREVTLMDLTEYTLEVSY